MPKILKQGENYDGDFEANKAKEDEIINGPEKDVTENTEQQSSDNTQTANKKPFKENTVLIVAVLGAVVVVFVIILGMLISRKNKSLDNTSVGGTFDAAEDLSAEEEDDLFNQLMSNAEGGEIIDQTMEQPIGVVEEYSDQEAVELRKHGYTADEIDWSREHGITYDSMIVAAELAAEELAKEKIKILGDTGSPEYQALINKTWLGGEEFEMSEVLPDESGAYDISYLTQVINADYVKCGQQGYQLFLCISTETYGNLFLAVEPKRWMQLAESGNIVIEVNVCHYGGKDIVTSITEVDTGDHPDM